MGATPNIFVAYIRHRYRLVRSDKNLSGWTSLVRSRINPTMKKFIPISDSPLSDIEMLELGLKRKFIFPFSRKCENGPIFAKFQKNHFFENFLFFQKSCIHNEKCRFSLQLFANVFVIFVYFHRDIFAKRENKYLQYYREK
jgi:hypothetical protein